LHLQLVASAANTVKCGHAAKGAKLRQITYKKINQNVLELQHRCLEKKTIFFRIL